MSVQRNTSRRGFSLVELLVVVTIILLLIGIAFPAFLSIRKNASRTATESQLQAMASAIDQFKADFNYLPPLILDDPEVPPGDPRWCTSMLAQDNARDVLRSERYHSIYSLPIYLLGLGALNPDTTLENPDRHDGVAGVGFRDPGHDRAWGGARQRTPATHRFAASGQVYRPYVNFADSELVRPADASGNDFAEYDVMLSQEEDSPWRSMSVIVDNWGTPIRYYRAWPTRSDTAANDSLLDAPAELVDPEALRDAPETAIEFDANRDPDLARGSYALLSAGPDKIFTPLGFAQQGPDPTGSVDDFLREVDFDRRPILIRDSMEDNVRLVR